MNKYLILLAACAAVVSATTIFSDNFENGDFSKWKLSTHKGAEAGKFEVVKSAGGEYVLKTTQDARFYQASAHFNSVSNKGKPFVIQFSVAHVQSIDCGGGYVKILPDGLDQADFHGESDYAFMFGPDICGATKKVHVIINYKGKNHLVKKDIPCMTDDLVHLYTLIVKPDNSFVVKIDNEQKEAGSFEDEKYFDILPPKEIEDETISKPKDWVDSPQMDDPSSVKPAGWDDIPATVADPDAKKPDDWDDELDGTWEAPTIANPAFKGEWKPARIDNPAYKGPWKATMKANPDYFTDSEVYAFKSISFIGIDVWQVKSGTQFDDFLLTDSIEEADAAAQKFLTKKAAEDKIAADKKEADRKAAEEASKAASAGDDAGDMHDHDHDHGDAHDEL